MLLRMGIGADGARGSRDRKVPVQLEARDYVVKTAETEAEIHGALRLRHDVFLAEGLGKPRADGIDTDAFDAGADHLIVVHRPSGRVVGNYRIRASQFTNRFYSESEFCLGRFVAEAGGSLLEVGRACVDRDHRRGAVLQLLWRGLIAYSSEAEASLLFGCSSVPAEDPEEVSRVWSSLVAQGRVVTEFGVYPWNPFPVRLVREEPGRLPPLLSAYLRNGASILGYPAYDPEFRCADFLTALDLRACQESYARRYDLCRNESATL